MVLEPLKTDLRASEPTRSLYSNRTKRYFSRNSLARPIFRQSLGFSIFPFCTPPGNIYGRPLSKNLKKKKKKKKNGWIRPLLRMIIMIIEELSGRCRQSPIVLGGEGQSLGTKDALSIGPLDTHWSHVFINPVRCIYIGNSCFAEAYELNTDLRSNAGCVSNTQSNNYTKLIFNSSCRELSNDSKQAVDRMLLSTKFVAWANY